MTEEYINQIQNYFEARKYFEETFSCTICGIVYHTEAGFEAHQKNRHYEGNVQIKPVIKISSDDNRIDHVQNLSAIQVSEQIFLENQCLPIDKEDCGSVSTNRANFHSQLIQNLEASIRKLITIVSQNNNDDYSTTSIPNNISKSVIQSTGHPTNNNLEHTNVSNLEPREDNNNDIEMPQPKELTCSTLERTNEALNYLGQAKVITCERGQTKERKKSR